MRTTTNKAEGYEKRIRACNRADLLNLWAGITKGVTPGWPEGKAFEYLILRAFELEGARVTWPFSVKQEDLIVEQIDGVIYADGLYALIEAKDKEKNPINIEPVAKLRNQLLRRPASVIGMVFSHSGFTEPAKVLTRYVAPQTILLWEGDEIALALEKEWMRAGLRTKFQYAVEKSIPDYNLKLGVLP